MKRSMSIKVSKTPKPTGIVACRSVSLRERILRFLFGGKQRVTILIPGDSIDEVAISESGEEGEKRG